MKVDIYTKLVLSVIAICLCWLCFSNMNLSETAAAAAPPPPQEVVIAGVKSPNGLLPVTISGVAPAARLAVVVSDVTMQDHTLPVKIWGVNTADQLLPVSIKSVKQGTTWDALSIKTAANK